MPGLAFGGFLEFITLCCELPAEGWWAGGGSCFGGGSGHTCAQLVLRPQPSKLQNQEVSPAACDSGLGLLLRLFPPRGQARSHFLSWGFSLSRLLGPMVGWTPSRSALRSGTVQAVLTQGNILGELSAHQQQRFWSTLRPDCTLHLGFETPKCSSGQVPALVLTSLSHRGA